MGNMGPATLGVRAAAGSVDRMGRTGRVGRGDRRANMSPAVPQSEGLSSRVPLHKPLKR